MESNGKQLKLSCVFCWTFLTIIFVNLIACSSIPLATAWKYRNHGIKEFMALEPKNIQAKVQSSQDLVITQTYLSVEIEYDQEKKSYAFPLERNLHKQIAIKKWLGEDELAEFSEWKISAQGIEDFRRLQEDWQKEYSHWYAPNSESIPSDGFSFSYSVSTQFTQDSKFKDGYFSIWIKLYEQFELFFDEQSTNDIYEQLKGSSSTEAN